jgi:hypothetical protein
MDGVVERPAHDTFVVWWTLLSVHGSYTKLQVYALLKASRTSALRTLALKSLLWSLEPATQAAENRLNRTR